MTDSNLGRNIDGSTAVRAAWSDFPDATLSQYGRRTLTSYDSPIDMVSNGTEWVPVNGQATLDIDNIPVGIAPSGTIATGASGHLTIGTALPHTYSAGIWLYIVSAGTTPALAAGLYWVVMTNTTVGTIYTNGPGSAAYNFTVGAAYTGTTNEITVRTVSILGNLMGAQGQIVVTPVTSISGTASAKTQRSKLGASTCSTQSTTTGTNTAFTGSGSITNVTSAIQTSSGTFSYGVAATANVRTTIDTTTAQNVTLTLQMSTPIDYIINHSWRVDLYNI